MTCQRCGKRCHGSKHAALLSQRSNGTRMRAYYSTECRCWHVTKNEKY